MNCFTKILYCLLFCLLFNSLEASHNASRYFPFLERPGQYILENGSQLTSGLFYIKADTAFARGGGNAGIPELFGKYDLRDLIFSLKQVKGDEFIDPIEEEKGPFSSWSDKSIRFRVNGKAKAKGAILNYQHCFDKFANKDGGFKYLSIGFSLPFMYLNTSDNFYFLDSEFDSFFKNLTPTEKDQLSRIRRRTHDLLGLDGGNWTQSGLGDLDLMSAVNFTWDYKWLMRQIDLNLRLGVVFPTGAYGDLAYSSSLPFMGDGHWSSYFDVLSQFELKQDWKLGVLLGLIYQFDNAKLMRLPVYQEPAIFSALITRVDVDKGYTFKFSPYFIAENLTDGVDFHVRYTYLRHSDDQWNDLRYNVSVNSYLNQKEGLETWDGKTLTKEDIEKNIASKKDLTRWRMHYISLELLYDSKEAGNDWILDPKIFIAYDYQFSGNGCAKTHQLTLGAQMHF